MVRAFEAREIPRGVVERLLANAQCGPSCDFSLGFEFLVFDGSKQAGRFWRFMAAGEVDKTNADAEVMRAPLIVVPVAHPDAYVRRYLEPDKAHVGRKTAKDWPAAIRQKGQS